MWLLKVSDNYLEGLDAKKFAESGGGKRGRNLSRKRQLEKYFAYKDELRYLADKQGFVMPMGCFCVTFYIEHPRTWRKKKVAEMVGKPHQSKPDADNMLKSLFDALIPKKNRSAGQKGKDDKELWSYSVFKYWAEEGGGRIEISEYDESEYLDSLGGKDG